MSDSAVETLQHPALSALKGVRHAFFTRRGGVSGGVYASLNGGLGSADLRVHVLENRRRMAAALEVAPDRLLTVHQVHSADVVTVDGPWGAEGPPRADGLVTRMRGLALAAAAADCGPVLFADAQAGVIGAAHAGWKGALGGVLEATIATMEREGAARGRIVAVLGPTISRAAYEVGPEFVARFSAADAGYDRFFAPSTTADHAMFDLPGFILARLEQAGVAVAADLGRCTYGDEASFFSYRRTTHRAEPDYGRHLHAIALEA